MRIGKAVVEAILNLVLDAEDYIVVGTNMEATLSISSGRRTLLPP